LASRKGRGHRLLQRDDGNSLEWQLHTSDTSI
jgi:hypothetical protein